MTATLHLPASVCMCVYVYVCVCEWECETGIEICAQGQSTDLPVFFFISLCFVISVFILEREQRSKAALQVFAALYAKFTQIAADNANEENGRLKRAGGEESGAEAAATQIKSNFQFPELAKIEKFTAATRAHTHTHSQTHLHLHTQRQIKIRVPLFKNSKKLRASVAQLTERLFIANSCCNYKNYAALTALLLRPQ